MGTITAGYKSTDGTLSGGPVEFATLAQAVRYLSNTVERFWDEDYAAARTQEARERADDRWLGVHTELHSAAAQRDGMVSVTGGGVEFWTTPTEYLGKEISRY